MGNITKIAKKIVNIHPLLTQILMGSDRKTPIFELSAFFYQMENIDNSTSDL